MNGQEDEQADQLEAALRIAKEATDCYNHTGNPDPCAFCPYKPGSDERGIWIMAYNVEKDYAERIKRNHPL